MEKDYEDIVKDVIASYKDKKGEDTVEVNVSDLRHIINRERFLTNKIDHLGEVRYESGQYGCGGYFCTVATTGYEPDERKQICSRCLAERILDGEFERWDYEKLSKMMEEKNKC